MSLSYKKSTSCVLAFSLCLNFSQLHAASEPPVAARDGMVVTAQHLATDVGARVLAEGGNAVDAAIAVGYALAVVYPAAGNLGGGGFMTLRLADGTVQFIDFRETAPAAATAKMYLDENGQVIPGLSTLGYKAVGVPGTVAGLELARERFATLPRKRLVAPSIVLAQKGFVLEQGDVDMIEAVAADLRKDSATAAIFLNADGSAPKAGDRLIQKDLAESLKRIAKNGRDGFYRGATATRLADASKAGGGLITEQDLASYQAKLRAPLECDYRGFHVISAPPPSSGGVVLCEILNILEAYPLSDAGWGSAQATHWMIEAMRHAYVDRNHYLGDPDFVENPIARLLDDAHAGRIRGAIHDRKAGDSDALAPGKAPHEGSNTTHYSIADADGNVVAVTYTLNDWFGAKVTAAGTGILLNNEMDDFTSAPGVPNLYGLVQGEANAIAPGKRPLSSMTPTIVLRDGQPFMVVGTPGGSRIITAVLHTIVNVIDFGMNIQEAVDAPRFHQQWQPEATAVEARALSPDTRMILELWGHVFTEPQPENHLAAILIGAPALGASPVAGNRFYGANDPRRGTGSAKGPEIDRKR
ncbi:gamma-glutamyltransferase [Ahniella affigens]|uniref:Glutathione hydrolase proenzyme n=1 Tax=Ahniella affigens TaxID=2021234 RepID=A0A2P1PZ82_9GAMM|nr:gamma-glutamyltransferase [Ahniella affigens]AVQ00150.1 gamma-glutamyltransferase [Ahniella affigens]